MAGILRLSNTGTGNGQSTITSAASGDTTYTLPSGGGTFVTTGSTQSLTVPFASGTAGAPSVTFIGDTDTGLYSPGANQVAIATSGVGHLFVDEAGNTTANGIVNAVEIAAGARYNLRRAEGSYDSPTAITTTSNIGSLLGQGYDGAAYRNTAGIIFASDGAVTNTSSPGYMTFVTTASGAVTVTERARIDSSGRLLVGTSNGITAPDPAGDNRVGSLQLAGNLLATTMQGNHFFEANATGPLYQFTKSNTSTIGSHAVVASGDRLGTLQWSGSDGTNYIRAAQIRAEVDGTPGTNDMPGRLVFSTTADGASSPTERMRINQKGAVHFSTNGTYTDGNAAYNEIYQTNSNVVALYVRHTGTDPYGFQIVYDQAKNNTGNEFLYCNDSSAQRAVIRSNGGIANYQANDVNLSDINTKKDIAPAAGTWDCIKEWEIVNYRYKDQPDDADLNLGVIAQQVAESCPEVITVFEEAKDDKPEKLGVKEQQMYWMAIKALQEAQVRIEALEAEVAALKAA